MFGILIEYDFSGDEAEWREAVDTFIGRINADDRLKGRFSYQVKKKLEGNGRVHIGQWDNEETLTYLQSQPFFGEFAGKIKEFSGGGPNASKFEDVTSTGG